MQLTAKKARGNFFTLTYTILATTCLGNKLILYWVKKNGTNINSTQRYVSCCLRLKRILWILKNQPLPKVSRDKMLNGLLNKYLVALRYLFAVLIDAAFSLWVTLTCLFHINIKLIYLCINQ